MKKRADGRVFVIELGLQNHHIGEAQFILLAREQWHGSRYHCDGTYHPS